MSESFTCFDSSAAAFSEIDNCLYFTILLIYGIITTIIILALAVVLCVQEQKVSHDKYDSESSSEFQANPFQPGPNNMNLGYHNQAYNNQQRPIQHVNMQQRNIQPTPTAQMVQSGEFGAEQNNRRKNKKERSTARTNNTNMPRMNYNGNNIQNDFKCLLDPNLMFQ